VHGDERVVAAEGRERGADGGRQVAVVVTLDQVGDDLGVGLGAEEVAVVDEVPPQLGVVLDDPVEDDVDAVRAIAVRVRVLLADPAVRRPPSVATPIVAGGAATATPPSRPGSAATAARRFSRLPTARIESICPSWSSEIPAES